MSGAGKGDRRRPCDLNKFNKHWDEIFNKSSDDRLVHSEDIRFNKRTNHSVLRNILIKMDLTESDLAKKTGISIHNIVLYEEGKKEITPYVAQVFANALNTHPEIFITKEHHAV